MNVDIFSNERYKLSYINFQLVDNIIKVTQVRCNLNCDNLYLTVNELLKKLVQSFHDSDKKDNYHREYINLIQESKKFSDFFNHVTIVSLTTQDIYRDQTVITITRLEI